MNSLKSSLLRADLLGAETKLRSRGQPFYESIFGGALSIITFLFFAIVFIFKIQDAFELRLISYTKAEASSLSNFSSEIQKPMFSINFPLMTPEDIETHIDVVIKVIDFAPESELLTLRQTASADYSDAVLCNTYDSTTQQCFNQEQNLTFTCSHYFEEYCFDNYQATYGANFDEVFSAYKESRDITYYDEETYQNDWEQFGTWKGSSELSTEELIEYNFFEGSHAFTEKPLMRISIINASACASDFFHNYGTSTYTLDPTTAKCAEFQASLVNNLRSNSKLKVEINCRNKNLDGTCGSQTQTFLLPLYGELSSSWVEFLIVDTVFSPTKSNDYSNFIRKIKNIELDYAARSILNIELSTFEVETDESFFPWTDLKVEEGYFVENIERYTLLSSSYRIVEIYLEKSQIEFSIEREYGKIDDIISYFGGLFGLIFVAVTFLAGSFNEIRYELMVANQSFKTSGDDLETKFSVFTYAGYMLYDWLGFFGFQPRSWSRYRKINESRSESNHILDVVSLQKRILYLENCMEVILDENQRMCIQFIKKPDIEEFTMKRELSEKVKEYVEKQNQKSVKHIVVKSVRELKSRANIPEALDDDQETEQRKQEALKMLFSCAEKKSQQKPEEKDDAVESIQEELQHSGVNFMKKKSLEVSEQSSQSNESSHSFGTSEDEMGLMICEALENILAQKGTDPYSKAIYEKLIETQQRGQKEDLEKFNGIGVEDIHFIPAAKVKSDRVIVEEVQDSQLSEVSQSRQSKK